MIQLTMAQDDIGVHMVGINVTADVADTAIVSDFIQ